MESLIVPQGTFSLFRYPHREPTTLRAWDAADEYLLRHLAEEQLPGAGSSVLIVNDRFGALAVALAGHRPQMVSDSYLAHRGTEENLRRNGVEPESVRLWSSLRFPDGVFDVVLLKVPKSLALLEDQLHRLRPRLHAGTVILGGGMSRHIHTSTLDLFERLIGPTRTSLARKKARLVFSRLDPHLAPGASPYPTQYILDTSAGTGYRITNHAAVFSQKRLDIGTRFFLDHLPVAAAPATIIDLGCGNGVVGLVAALQHPDADLVFCDASFMAVASARATFEDAFGATRKARFRVADGLEGLPEESADLVLNNPPFHQQHAVGVQVALRMFSQARDVLRPGGELRVVGNRHLGYHAHLERLYGNVAVMAGNRKFVVLSAVKRG